IGCGDDGAALHRLEIILSVNAWADLLTGTGVRSNVSTYSTRSLSVYGDSARPSEVQLQLQELVDYPREDLGTEVKDWLDLSDPDAQANLAQALLALANHGGGFVLIGFVDTATGWRPANPRPQTLNGYSQARVNGIVQKYAEPPFHCDV